VTAGPYRLARHPSELGLLLILCGGALLLGSAWAAGLAAISLPLAALRCRREDRALAHHPGHAAWARRVGWVAPRAFRPRPHATGPATGA
jgi:protein-S-isoprenylcysteine O-methyltransferase Ste14